MELLLLHGALGCAEQFGEFVKKLEKDFVVTLVDFPGHGANGQYIDDMSLDSLTHFLIRFVAETFVSPPFVFGYSMGGYVALNACLKKPGLFSGVFTLATKFDWTIESAEKEVKMLNPEMIKTKVPLFAKDLEKRHTAVDWTIVCKNTASMMLKLGKSDSIHVDYMSGIDVPVRFAVGDRDKMVTIAETENYYIRTPKGSMLVLPETYHPFEKVNLTKLAHELIWFCQSIIKKA